MAKPDDEPDDPEDLSEDPDLDPEDPDLNPLLEHATRTELDAFLPLAMRFLEADGDQDRDDYPPGEAIIEGVLVAAAAGYLVGGSGDKVFSAGMSFVLSDRHRHVVKAWRLVAARQEEGLATLLGVARKRAAERRNKEPPA